MNDEFTNEQATLMAESVAADVGNDVGRQVERVFWRSLSRPPSEAERADCVQFIHNQRKYHQSSNGTLKALADLCHVMFNLNEFVYLD